MRFPVAFDGKYTYAPDATTGKLEPRLAPINGTEQDYLSTHLPKGKLFSGKELVAEITANAGIALQLPGLGTQSLRIDVGKDFTADLPAPFTHGQFTPPMPGGPALGFTKVFEDFDLIAGYGNYGIAGGKVFPTVQVGVTGKELSAKVLDLYDGGRAYTVQGKAQGSAGAINLRLDKQAAHFEVRDPSYAASFSVTPGIRARLFVDIGVWGSHWDWDVSFPQLSFSLPANGLTFGCHDATVCQRKYRYTPGGQESQWLADQIAYSKSFSAVWQGKCLDEVCRQRVAGVRDQYLALAKPHEHDPSDAETRALWNKAAKLAQGHVDESRLNADSEQWVNTLLSVWGGRCIDKRCVDEVGQLGPQMVDRAAKLRREHPDSGNAVIHGMMGKEYTPRLQAAVEASLSRTAAQALAQIKRGGGRPAR